MAGGEVINSGDGIDKPRSLRIVDEGLDEFNVIKNAYSETTKAQVDPGFGVDATYSMFNPFNVIHLNRFGGSSSGYDPKAHYDNTGRANTNQSETISSSSFYTGINTLLPKENSQTPRLKSVFSTNTVENPTVSTILNWGKTAEKNPFAAYSVSDFLFCKYYGLIPNNRLLTLRRYSIPVEDNLKIADDKTPLVPIAQAVSWFGQETNNQLKSILKLDWGLNWKWLPATTVEDIQGNELTAEDILAQIGASDPKIASILKSQLLSDRGTTDMQALTGFEKEIQGYIKKSYTTGPYWNRILGPVNVINETQIRDRGMKRQNPFTLEFHYSLRSYKNINPKVAFLDLLSNFMSLTYNSAPFWGGGFRYFKKPGIALNGLPGQAEFEKGEILKGFQEMLKGLMARIKYNNQDLKVFLNEIQSYVTDGVTLDAVSKIGDPNSVGDNVLSRRIDALLAPIAGKLMRAPIAYRSILDGRAIGEWHLTIGNPMNPIAVMGNLVVSKVEMVVGETLGLDDFPTEYTFKVTLDHGRPRAKQDIESIFNLGGGAIAYTELTPPSSTYNSYGEQNSKRINAAYGDGVTTSGTEGSDSLNNSVDVRTGMVNSSVNEQLSGTGEFENISGIGAVDKTKNLDSYKARVSSFYGDPFGKSPILESYFNQVSTKD